MLKMSHGFSRWVYLRQGLGLSTTAMSSTKMPTYYQENVETISTSTPSSDPEKIYEDPVVGANLELDENALPPGYFRSKFFVGTMAGIGLGLCAGVAAFGYAAPILGTINADIGPVSTFKRLRQSSVAHTN
jgi:hypothetical protein